MIEVWRSVRVRELSKKKPGGGGGNDRDREVEKKDSSNLKAAADSETRRPSTVTFEERGGGREGRAWGMGSDQKRNILFFKKKRLDGQWDY